VRRTTVAATIAVALLVAVCAAVLVLAQRPRPGADPAKWPVEVLAADPAVALPYALHVTPDGCPGFSLSSPVPEDNRIVPGSGSSTVQLAPGHYALWACFGTVDETEGARRTVAHRISTPNETLTSMNAALVRAPFGEVVRVDGSMGGGPPRLTDWMTDHGGYTYGIGYMHPDGDASRRAVVEAMIASVVWDQ